MQLFSIRDVERLTGIKAHTLRVWEQRYGLVLPHRKESNHRYYTNEDLKEILRVAFLYNNGFKISRIARLTEVSRAQAIQETLDKEAGAESIIENLLVTCKALDTELFTAQIREIFGSAGLEQAMVKVIYPYLERVGLLWMNDKMLAVQEHFGSQIILHQMVAAFMNQPNPPLGTGNFFLLFGPEHEFHEIPLLFVHYLLRKYGAHCLYLGINTTLDMVKTCLQHHPVTHIYYHQVTNFTDRDAEGYLDRLCGQFPHLQVVAGGRALNSVSRQPVNGKILRNLDDMLSFARGPWQE